LRVYVVAPGKKGVERPDEYTFYSKITLKYDENDGQFPQL
jgi:hypothetical protein